MQVGAAPGLAGYSAPPPRDIPLRVQVAFSIYHTIASRAAVAVASSHQGDTQKDPKLSTTEEKTRDAALGIITRYMSGEHDYEDKAPPMSDLARAGVCEFYQLPPIVQLQLRTQFPAGYQGQPMPMVADPQPPAPPAVEPPGEPAVAPPPPTATDVDAFIERAQPRPPDDPGAATPAVPG